MADIEGFLGNVEGRDLARVSADVIVTDGFTGNVALKTLEGAMMGIAGLVFNVLDEAEFNEISMPIKLRKLREVLARLVPIEAPGESTAS